MNQWRLLQLNELPPIETQTIYHSVAKAMAEDPTIPSTLIICWPEKPLVCVGYHQIIEDEIDVSYCKEKNLPIVRRCLGGGAVYLDKGQLFYQIIARVENKTIPKKVEKFYKKILEAPVETYRKIGINANYIPINDIEYKDKKISGNGAAVVDGERILTGNIIFDFNFDEMVRILKVPNEKFRDKVAKSLSERMGTITQFLDIVPSREKVSNLLKQEFGKSLNTKFIESEKLTEKEKDIQFELLEEYTSSEWLHMPIHRKKDLIADRKIKISGKTQLYEAVHKTPGGLLRVYLEIENNAIKDIIISGDFSIDPMNAVTTIENALIGKEVDQKIILKTINKTFQKHHIDTPGINPKDIAKAITLACKKLFS
ncbi:MAG: lipoate--protein ligase [Asgard group archaeon]|nr:lipoate--protein ligase [Asgard group archaeon]